MNKRSVRKLEGFHACSEAVEWFRTQPSLREAWESCQHSDWMLWFLEELEADSKLFVEVACRIARTVLHLIPDGEDRPRKAIEAAEGWLDGKVTAEEVDAAWASASEGA